MTTLPALADWDSTRQTLHAASALLVAVRKQLVPRQPNFAHLGLFVTPQGLTTGPLPNGAELELRFAEGALAAGGWRAPLAGMTMKQLAVQVMAWATSQQLAVTLDEAAFPAEPALAMPTQGAEYALALETITAALARVKARLYGTMSPLIVFPHGFDLSFLWFARGSEEAHDPHLNIGFSPGSAGLPRPYAYLYAQPLPAAFFEQPLPQGARWQRQGWNGVVIEYDLLRTWPHAAQRLEALLLELHRTFAPLLV